MRKRAMVSELTIRKSDGVRVEYEKKSAWVRVQHQKKSDGVRTMRKRALG